MIPANDLIEYLQIPLREAWGYIWGKYGQMWTEGLQAQMERTTAQKYATARQYGSRWIGHRVADCSGLVRWVMLQFGVKVAHSSNALWMGYCTKQGKLVDGQRADGYELCPGSAVFLCDKSGNRHHVGMYMGDGICIEAKGTRYGVVTSPLSHWDEWGELKEVEYFSEKERDPMRPTLRKGDRGEDVKRLQTMLNQYGYELKVDGIFGTATDQAVRAFQQSHRLTVDGICGAKTWAALDGGKQTYTVIIPGLSEAQATALAEKYSGAKIEKG